MFTPVKIDLVDELRLRRWARMNYLPADRRSDAWHPVILDEMQVQDRENKIAPRAPKWLSHVPHIESPAPMATLGTDELYYT